MHHVTRFCMSVERVRAGDPTGWIGVRPLAVQRIWGSCASVAARRGARPRGSWTGPHEARHRRWTFHFTPTSASWLNAVKGVFATLTRRRLKREGFVSVVDLQEAIHRFVVEHNAKPKPFTCTADPAPSDAGPKC